jgi:hypothetical protein
MDRQTIAVPRDLFVEAYSDLSLPGLAVLYNPSDDYLLRLRGRIF